MPVQEKSKAKLKRHATHTFWYVCFLFFVLFLFLLFFHKLILINKECMVWRSFSYYKPARPLRSSTDLPRLLVPNFHSVAGERRFAVAAAKEWNCLLECIRTAHSTNVFKKSLKTHLLWLDFVVFAYVWNNFVIELKQSDIRLVFKLMISS